MAKLHRAQPTDFFFTVIYDAISRAAQQRFRWICFSYYLLITAYWSELNRLISGSVRFLIVTAVAGRARALAVVSPLTSAVGPAGLQAGGGDAVARLRGVRQVEEAAAPVLHPSDGTVLQPGHDVSDREAPGPVGWGALLRGQGQIRTLILTER